MLGLEPPTGHSSIRSRSATQSIWHNWSTSELAYMFISLARYASHVRRTSGSNIHLLANLAARQQGTRLGGSKSSVKKDERNAS